jgi:hypothetical protein
MISWRTIVLFCLAIETSVLLGIQEYKARPRCGLHTAEIRVGVRHVSYQEQQVGFDPCFVDIGLSVWTRMLAISWFFLCIAFMCSFIHDVFLYVRGCRRAVITGRSRWLK